MHKLRIGRAALHMWEEPCISGNRGSGAVFFCGCNLRCVFCQNYSISRGQVGHLISIEELAQEMLRLQDEGANNINLVTAGHFMPAVIKSLESAKRQGLRVPIVYNTSSYESVEEIKRLEGVIDVYLPDLKYKSSELSARYSGREDYFDIASKAIEEMVRQTQNSVFIEEMDIANEKPFDMNSVAKYTKDDFNELCEEKSLIMTRGTIVRHLLLPGCTKDSKEVIKYLLETFGNDIFISVMNQYTPMERIKDSFPEIYRKVTEEEYDEILEYAIDNGMEYGFFQDGDVAEESFIPEFE